MKKTLRGVTLSLSATVLVAVGTQGTLRGGLITIDTVEQFNELVAKGNSVVKFSADWCPACNAVKDHYAELADETTVASLAQVNVENQKLAQVVQENGIRGLPTFVFSENGTVKDKIEGAPSADKEQFKQVMNDKMDSTFSQSGQEAGGVEHETMGFLCKVKAFFSGLFSGIKNAIGKVLAWIKGLFGM